MTEILGLFQNYHLICSFAGFVTAQLVKFILTLVLMKKIDFRKFFEGTYFCAFSNIHDGRNNRRNGCAACDRRKRKSTE